MKLTQKNCEEFFALVNSPKPLNARVYPLKLPNGKIWTGACLGCFPGSWSQLEKQVGASIDNYWKNGRADGLSGVYKYLDTDDERGWLRTWWKMGYWVEPSFGDNLHLKERARIKEMGLVTPHDYISPFTYKQHINGYVRYYRNGKLINPHAVEPDTIKIGRTPRKAPPLPPAGTIYDRINKT